MAEIQTVKVRQSNIELLRILAIFTVLIGHAGMAAGGMLPSKDDFQDNTLSSILCMLPNGFVIGGVDVFVLISGWFGIHANSLKLSKLIFQVAFLSWGIYAAFIVLGLADINIVDIKASMGIYGGYWFVMAYLGMYILSPVLNAFADHASKKQFSLLLFAFYAFQCYYSWFWSMVNYFNGYSIVLFCGLYLTARYFRMYEGSIFQRHPWKIYIGISLLVSLVAEFGILITDHPLKMLRYDNPLVIISAVAVVHAFSKLRLQSNIINRLARACFAVYIIHFNPLVFPYFKQGIVYLQHHYSTLSFFAYVTLYLVLVYIACALIDFVREKAWCITCKLFSIK